MNWNASCKVIDEPIGYFIKAVDKIAGKTAYNSIMKTVNNTLSHVFSQNVKYDTEYVFSVYTDAANAYQSNSVLVKSLPLPQPEAFTTFPNLNTSMHDVMWKYPKKMSSYLQKQVKNKKVTFR